MWDESIDVLVYPTTTDRGKVIPDYTATPTATPITGVDIQDGPSAELVAMQRSGVSVRSTVFIPLEQVPSGVTLNARSIVRFAGDTYQVDGQPGLWANRLGYLVLALVDWSVQ